MRRQRENENKRKVERNKETNAANEKEDDHAEGATVEEFGKSSVEEAEAYDAKTRNKASDE